MGFHFNNHCDGVFLYLWDGNRSVNVNVTYTLMNENLRSGNSNDVETYHVIHANIDTDKMTQISNYITNIIHKMIFK